MSNTQIIECRLDFNKGKRCRRSFPKGAKILKNNHDQKDPYKIFAFYEGTPNGHKEDFIFFLIKQEKAVTEISKDVTIESKEHIKTFANEQGTFHIFKLNHE